MKTIFRSLFLLLIIAVLVSSTTGSGVIRLKASGSNLTEQSLQKSTGIVLKRLHYVNIEAKATADIASGQITIVYEGTMDFKSIDKLLTSRGDFGFFAEKNGRDQRFLGKEDIQSATSKTEKSGNSSILITFTKDSAPKWASATKENIGKSIKIMLDGKVYYDPVVRQPIENGQCEMTGNFSREEADIFLALLNTETLPVNLTLK